MENPTPLLTLSKIPKENPQINIILTYSDPGVCNARNVGIDLSTREYSIFIDDDDYISHNYFEKLYQYSQKTELLLEHLWTLMKIPEKFKNLIYQNHF